MVAPYVGGDEERFRQFCKSEAEELIAVSFGDCLLFVVAEIYRCRAAEFVGYRKSTLGVDGHVAAWKGKKISFDNHTAAAGAGIRAAGAALRTYRMVKEIADKSEGEPADPLSGLSATQLKATQDSLPIFLEAMWHVSVIDIERTITTVTHKLCRDHSVDEVQRLRRAQALGIMGEVFMEVATSRGGSKDPKSKVAEMVAIMVPPSASGAGTSGADAAGEAQQGASGGGGGGGAAARGGGATQQRCSLEELRQMKVGELKRRLRERGITDPDAVEKEELVQLLFGLQESEGSAQ